MKKQVKMMLAMGLAAVFVISAAGCFRQEKSGGTPPPQGTEVKLDDETIDAIQKRIQGYLKLSPEELQKALKADGFELPKDIKDKADLDKITRELLELYKKHVEPQLPEVEAKYRGLMQELAKTSREGGKKLLRDMKIKEKIIDFLVMDADERLKFLKDNGIELPPELVKGNQAFDELCKQLAAYLRQDGTSVSGLPDGIAGKLLLEKLKAIFEKTVSPAP